LKLLLLNKLLKEHKQKFLLLVFVFSAAILPAQEEECPVTKNKKALGLFDQALVTLKTGKAETKERDAIKFLNEALEIAPKFYEAHYVLGDIFWQKALKAQMSTDEMEANRMSGYFTRAKKSYLMVIGLCPSYMDYSSYNYLGEYFYGEDDYKKAAEYLKVFIEKNKGTQVKTDIAEKKYRQCIMYEDLLNNPVPFNPVPLKGVCSKEDEFLPLISPDGEYAFFTHRYYKTGMTTHVGGDFIEEFTFSQRKSPVGDPNEEFLAGQPMPLPFNDFKSAGKQGAVTISIDNRELYVTMCQDTRDGYTNCDIYVSEFIDGEWSPLKNLGPNVNGVNSWESQPSISADGKVLYFASVRPGNIDFDTEVQNCDIWRSVRDETGKWGRAQNLGPTINTAGNEKSPFIHSDSQTLYFSSDGKKGIGGFDIYFSKQKEGRWSEPRNIGYPINSAEDDLGFIVSTDGKKAYFSSTKLEGTGGWDIYGFDLYEDARPKKVIFAKGQLLDDKGVELKDAKVEITSAKTSKVTEGMVDKKTGKYAIAVAAEPDEEFLMTVKKKDYTFTSQYIKPSEEKFDKPVKIDFEVKPIEPGKTVEIKDINFETASALFDRSSLIILDNFIKFLEENPKLKIEIRGHTDNEGDDATNLDLSIRRAKAVHDYLVLMGISLDRMQHKGFGETKPIASNETEEGRAKNRRTEFVIISK